MPTSDRDLDAAEWNKHLAEVSRARTHWLESFFVQIDRAALAATRPAAEADASPPAEQG